MPGNFTWQTRGEFFLTKTNNPNRVLKFKTYLDMKADLVRHLIFNHSISTTLNYNWCHNLHSIKWVKDASIWPKQWSGKQNTISDTNNVRWKQILRWFIVLRKSIFQYIIPNLVFLHKNFARSAATQRFCNLKQLFVQLCCILQRINIVIITYSLPRPCFFVVT